MATFAQAATAQANTTTTTNGMGALKSTGSEIVDLFYNIGAARNNQPMIVSMFNKAFNVEPTLALRTLFWARDVRGGAGERQTFRTILLELEKNDPEQLIRLLPFVPEYGRWDDGYEFKTPEAKQAWYDLVGDVLLAGQKAQHLLGCIDSMSEEECQKLLSSM